MLKEFVTFNDFIIFLTPGAIISLPTSFYYTLQYFKTDMGDKMEVNLEQLLADNPIRNHQLLIKTGVMLTVVIMGFFMHPLTHIDREYLRRRCNLARPFSRRASESGGLPPYTTNPCRNGRAAVWVAIPGAIIIFLLDDHHDVEKALHSVECAAHRTFLSPALSPIQN